MKIKHLLDNPVWSAQISGNKGLALGNIVAKYFPLDMSPFVGLNDFSKENFDILYETIPFDNPVAIFTNKKNLITNPWKIINRIEGYQMVYPNYKEENISETQIERINGLHIQEMLSLVKLTNPGPFLPRTIDFGNYEGIFNEKKLIAMAGQRLHSGNYVEISTVCTHPHYIGMGYARELIMNQIGLIQRHGKTPYLHVKEDNARAIKIYHSMGFITRTKITIYILKKQ
tara:strand:+ start:13670 stop:14356 length:687 start_codon:yes stop_codon:yes gene_type:complete